MRLSLAAKLCLLAATLVFCGAVGVGWLFFDRARTAVNARELVGLRDEAELCRRELLADVAQAQADLLAFATTKAARTLASDAVGALTETAGRTLKLRDH